MSSFELNKIFAAILVAGIVAMLGGFVAEHIVHPHELEKDAVEIEGGPVEGAGPAAEALPEPAIHLIAAADIAKGEKLSKACAACHSFEKGGPIKQGPNLWGVVGANKASQAGFAYSSAMVEHGGSWTYTELNRFLWKPKKFAPGTKMNYVGLKSPEDRAAMIAWLRNNSDSPRPLPSDAEITAEQAQLAPPKVEEAAEEAPSDAAAPEGVSAEPEAH